MRCPFCGHPDTQVKDSRPGEEGQIIRRRRFCPECASRFATTERVQQRELSVVKRSGERRPFERDKIARSMQLALRKRPVAPEALELAINRLVKQLEVEHEHEVRAERIGELVMDTLKTLDHVGYIRYASVYRDFSEISDFKAIMRDIDASG